MAIGKERRFYSEDKNKFLEDFCKQRLTYGNIEGNPEFKAGVCKLYKTIKLDEIIPTHGATGERESLASDRPINNCILFRNPMVQMCS